MVFIGIAEILCSFGFMSNDYIVNVKTRNFRALFCWLLVSDLLLASFTRALQKL